MAGRVALFLDANYVRKGAARLLGMKDCDLNWGLLSERLFGERPRLRAYYYDAVLTRWNAPDTTKPSTFSSSASR